jgi:CopA family copper-resistance protein
MKKAILAIILVSIFNQNIYAENRIVDLNVEYKIVNLTGKDKKAITVNSKIPAPTLHFKQGDHVTIKVHNKLDVDTAIHWHGIIIPWQMDGVEGVTQKGIPPGCMFKYEFTLEQSGTYWYHAHAGLQEQEGLYGAFLIDPPQLPQYKYTKDYVVVLSDWSNTSANQIFANLKKEGDYYSPALPLQPSLAKFVHDYENASASERKNIIDDYKMMQDMRMSLYDFSDVAYDAFLLNGHSKCKPWTASVKIGDVVRLRFIGAGASTIFHVKIPDVKMKMVHVQGNDVKPYLIDNFTISPGETYDILVKIEKDKPYIIYAESIDTSGAAYGALITRPNQKINYKDVTPFTEPLPVTREMMDMMMEDMSMSTSMNMTMNNSTINNKKTNQSNSMDPKKPANTSESMKQQMDMPTVSNDQNKTNSNATDKKSQVVTPDSNNMDGMSNASMGSMTPNHADHMNMSNNMKMNGGMQMSHSMSMNHSGSMNMPTEPSIIGDTISAPIASYTTSSGTKYQNLIAAVKTNDPDKPIHGIITMELFGYMDRYIWFINGMPEYKVDPIIFEPAKRYRFIFTNNSMMHHPMHIHGHWFILRKGNGVYDPLLHTIDVAPGATITADVDTDASGQWFFHCHMLYHMDAGMSRVFQYSSLLEVAKGQSKPQNIINQTSYVNRPIVRVDEVKPIDVSLVKHPMAHPMGLFFANFLDLGADPFHNVQRLNFKGLYGSDYNKLELFINDAEMKKSTVENADLDIFYWHLLDQFWAVKGGVNYFYRPAQTPYWQLGIGIEGIMPYFIATDVRGYYHSGSAKLDIELSRDSQMTNNFFIKVGLRSILASKTVAKAQIGTGLNQMRYIIRPYYRLIPGLNVFTEYEYQRNYGAFKNLQSAVGEPLVQNTVTLGFSIVF